MTVPFENDTGNIVRKLARKSLKSEKRRNLMVVIAVALASCLICFSIVMALSTRQIEKNHVEDTYEAVYTRITEEDVSTLKGLDDFSRVGEYYMLAVEPAEQGYNASYIYCDEETMYIARDQMKLLEGRLPQKEDEVVVSRYFLSNYGADAGIGEKVKDKKLMNPFATILFCEKCGAVMKRNVPAKTQNTSPWYRCPTRGCNCRTIKCDFLEAEVVKAMSQWWGEYTIKIKEDKVAQTDSTETALSIVREQLTELQLQQDKICEYLEKGIYTIEMFTKRNDTLTREIHKVQAAENELLKKQGAQKDIHDVEKEIIPTTQHILDSYPQLSVEEKNRLWKIVMERITAYRTPGGEVSIHIYPKLPMR